MRRAGWTGSGPELAGYAGVAIDNIGREFPAHISSMMNRPGDFPSRPRDRNPVFYGSLDWHSCVEMFWLLVRLLKAAPEDVPAGDIRAVLGARLTADGLQAEADFMATPHGAAIERPYGWGWALALAAELETWDDPDARRWAASFQPLSQALTENFLRWLPLATYPLRTGVHTNSAFGISRALSYANLEPDGELSQALRGAAQPLVRRRRGLSGRVGAVRPGLPVGGPVRGRTAGAVAAARGLPRLAGQFPARHRASQAALFTPALVTDSSDGYIAHLRGLNLSRAWCWRRLADSLPAGRSPG